VSGRPAAVRFARYGALAFEFSYEIAAGVLIGWAADRWLDTAPYGVLVMTLVAVVGSFTRLIILLRRFDRLDREAES
jgi:F0F1-type ATP synthase assembly protein I